jgi:tRNA-Thr(GGU) m(6)t(6)A37 methyltransferase TsaA
MGLLQRLRSILPATKALIPRDPVSYRPIGVVHNRVRQPMASGWQDVRSDIILRDELEEALDSLDGFSHVIVVYDLHLVPQDARRLKLPVGDTSDPERGVLATRSQLRPNPIGVSVVRVLHRRKTALRVLGLDAVDGTPVLDLKPYLPPYDAVPDAKLPDWATARTQ